MLKCLNLIVATLLLASFSCAHGGELVFSGTVQDEAGKPLAGYTLSFENGDYRSKAKPDPKHLFGKTKSDAKGTFSITLDKAKVKGCEMVVINPKGVIVDGYDHLNKSRDFKIVIAPPALFTARAVLPESSDEKKEDAEKTFPKLSMTLSLAKKECGHSVEVLTLTGDGKGVFEAPRLAPGKYHIAVKGGGYVASHKKYEHKKGNETFEFSLKQAASIYGVVSDGNNKPLADIEIAIGKETVRSDSKGAFKFKDLLARKHYIKLVTKGYAFENSSRLTVKVGEGEAVEQNIVLTKFGSISLRLIDINAEENDAAEGAFPKKLEIKLKKPRSYSNKKHEAERKEKAYLFNDIAPGTYELSLQSAELPSVTQEVTVIAEETSSVEIEIEESFGIAGRVTTDDGVGLEKARVSARIKLNGKSQTKRVDSDSEGNFSLRGLLPGEYRLHIEHGETSSHSQKVVVAAAVRDINVTLKRGATLTGKVINTQGQPLKDVRLSIESATYSENFTHRSARTKEDGSFAMSGVDKAAIILKLKHKEYVPKKIELAISEAYSFDEPIIMEGGFSFKGRVIDDAGVALDKISVSLSSVDDDYQKRVHKSSQSKADGLFEITGLPERKYKLRIDNKQYVKHEQEITVDSDQTLSEDIILKKGLSISGTIVESSGAPAANYRVSVSGPTGNYSGKRIYRSGRTKDDGSFELAGLVEGSFEFKVRADSEDLLKSEVTAGSSDLRFSLAAKETFLGVVSDSEGMPLKGVAIKLKSKAKAEDRFRELRNSNISNDEGEFSLELQRNKIYLITAHKPPYLDESITIDFTQADALPGGMIELQLKQGITIQGSITYKDSGLPAEGILVKPTKGRRNHFYGGREGDKTDVQALSDSGGTFVLTGLSSGICTLGLYVPSDKKNSRTPPLATKSIDTIQTQSVEFEIPATGGLSVELQNFSVAPYVGLSSTSQKGLHYNINHDKSSTKVEADSIVVGEYILTAGVYSKSGMGKMLKPKKITIEAGTTVEVAIDYEEKQEGTTVAGRIALRGKPLISGNMMVMPKPKKNATQEDLKDAYLSGAMKNCKIKDDGTFELNGMQTGEFSYRIWGARIETADARQNFSGTFYLEENQSELTIDITGFGVAGIVQDSNGNPVENANAQLQPTEKSLTSMMGNGFHARTDKEGRFTFNGINAAAYILTVSHRKIGRASQELAVENDISGITVVLHEGAELSGTVLDANGRVITGLRLTLRDANDKRASWVRIEEDGSFKSGSSLEKNSPYTLYASAPGYALKTVPFTLTENRVENINLIPGGSAKITVASTDKSLAGHNLKLHDASGTPIAHRSSAAHSWYGDMSVIQPTDKNGATTIEGLLPGSYTISIDGVDATQTIVVRALETSEVEFSID